MIFFKNSFQKKLVQSNIMPKSLARKVIPLLFLLLLSIKKVTSQSQYKLGHTIEFSSQDNEVSSVDMDSDASTIVFVNNTDKIYVYEFSRGSYWVNQTITSESSYCRVVRMNGDILVVGHGHQQTNNIQIYERESMSYSIQQSLTISNDQVKDIRLFKDLSAFILLTKSGNLHFYKKDGNDYQQTNSSLPIDVNAFDITDNGGYIVIGFSSDTINIWKNNNNSYSIINDTELNEYDSNNNNNVDFAGDGSKFSYYRRSVISDALSNVIVRYFVNQSILGQQADSFGGDQSINGLYTSEDGLKILLNYNNENKVRIFTSDNSQFEFTKEKIYQNVASRFDIAFNANTSIIVSSTDENIEIYFDCGILCQECGSNECSKCKGGASLNNNVCVCDNGYSYDEVSHQCHKTNCVNTSCTSCNFNEDCLVCSDKCVSCNLPFGNECTGCKDNEYLENQQCKNCTYPCKFCSTQYNCNVCQDGFTLINGKCSLEDEQSSTIVIVVIICVTIILIVIIVVICYRRKCKDQSKAGDDQSISEGNIKKCPQNQDTFPTPSLDSIKNKKPVSVPIIKSPPLKDQNPQLADSAPLNQQNLPIRPLDKRATCRYCNKQGANVKFLCDHSSCHFQCLEDELNNNNSLNCKNCKAQYDKTNYTLQYCKVCFVTTNQRTLQKLMEEKQTIRYYCQDHMSS